MTTVRCARESDYEALCGLFGQIDGLHARLQPGFFRSAPGMARTRRSLSLILGCATERLFVAEARGEQVGEVVGVVHVRVFDTPPSPLKVQRLRGHVEDLVVDEGHRRRGVGQALMDRAAAWCREQGASQLLLTVWEGNQAALGFYAGLGYQPVSQVLGLDLD